MKPREWIIFGVACAEKGSAAYDNFQWNEGNVRAIEYAAYEKLKAENERLWGVNKLLCQKEYDANLGFNDMKEERDTLKAKLAEVANLRECEFAWQQQRNEIEWLRKTSIYRAINELTREREAANVMRAALDKVKQFCVWLSVDSIKYQGTDAANAARWEMAAIVDALAKADEIRGGE